MKQLEQALKNNNNSQSIITHNNNSPGVHATFAERWRDRLWHKRGLGGLPGRSVYPPWTVTIILQQFFVFVLSLVALLRSVMLANSCRSLKRPAPINAAERRCKPRGGGTELALAAFRSTARSLSPFTSLFNSCAPQIAPVMALGGLHVPTGRRRHWVPSLCLGCSSPPATSPTPLRLSPHHPQAASWGHHLLMRS